MQREFLHFYNTELQHIREMAGEFAREYPKIASRLSLDREGKEVCPDPFVERLIEAFAFLSARVQLKLHSEFPRFTEALLETIFPTYLSPMPSMAIVSFVPNLSNKALAEGFVIPRGTTLPTITLREGLGQCLYRTAHTIKIWPITLREASYLDREAASLELPIRREGEAVLRFLLETPPGIPFSHLKLDSLDFFLRGSDDVPTLLLEAILTAGKGFAFRSYSPTSTSNRSLSHEWIILPSDCVKPRGLDPSDALLPVHSVVFDGYRLLMEYFAFWKRFRFFSLTGFESVRFSDTNLLEIAIPVGEPNSRVRPYVNPSFFGLYCTPVINLFPKRCDRISLDPPQVEYHIVPDRTRPLEFEVYCVEKVIGYGKTASEQIEFLPFYHTRDTVEPTQAFYTLHRRARMLSEKEKKFGRLSSYLGSEVWISLVKISPANFRSRLQQLGIEVLCTNRHLPLFLTQGDYEGAFVCEISGPIQSIRCLAGPTPPRPSYATGEFAWRLLSHLTLNYQPLISGDMRRAVSFLQEMLMLYVDPTDKGMQKHIEGLLSVESQPIFRRISHPGIISYVRGREIRFTFDEDNFTGVGIFLIGMVLERFFRRYATVNSFVETILCSRQRGQIYRWPTSTGLLSPI